MGKGGETVSANRGPIKLVGDKSEKITWAEVKKHVSCINLNSYIFYCYDFADSTVPLANIRSPPKMHGLFTKTKSTMYRIGTNIQAVELSSPMLVMI